MRRTVQLVLLATFVYLIAQTRWPPSNSVLVDAFLSIDPLLSLQAAIASRSWISSLSYGILILAMSMVLGRFFCGWICPMGTCLELGDDLIYGKKKKRKWKNRVRKLRGIKYALLLIILIGAVFGQGLAYVADPICWITRIFTYALWPIMTAAHGLALDLLRPVFESLGWMNWARAIIPRPVFGSFGIVSLLFFTFLLWLNRYQRRFWCRSICPLGALLAIPSRFALFHRRVTDACDDEGVCARVCQTGAIGEEFRKYDPMECIQCGACVSDCTQKATDFLPTLRCEDRASSFDLSRRHVLGLIGGGIVTSAWLAHNPKRLLLADEALRPPGSLPENDFLATCVRCGQCVKACPTSCLQPSALSTGIAGFMSPVAMMRLGPCDQNCNACGEVCPTDAIRSLDFDEKPYAKIGNAVINTTRCIVWEQNRFCLVCDEHCPYGAIYWKEVEPGRRLPFIDENRCNGCGQCETACPIDGSSAIRVYASGQIRLASESYRKTARDRGLILEEKKDILY